MSADVAVNAVPTLNEAAARAQALVDSTVKRLQEANAAVEPAARLFFPDGINLIYVKVEAGLTEKTKASVEIKVAGKGSTLSEDAQDPAA